MGGTCRSGLALVAALFAGVPVARAAGPTMAGSAVQISPRAEIEPAGVVFFPDEGRLEIRGRHLRGLRIRWPTQATSSTPANPTAPTFGEDVCVAPAAAAAG